MTAMSHSKRCKFKDSDLERIKVKLRQKFESLKQVCESEHIELKLTK